MELDHGAMDFERLVLDARCPLCGAHVPDTLIWHLTSVHGYRFRDVWEEHFFHTQCPCGLIVKNSFGPSPRKELYRHLLYGGLEHHMLCLLVSH